MTDDSIRNVSVAQIQLDAPIVIPVDHHTLRLKWGKLSIKEVSYPVKDESIEINLETLELPDFRYKYVVEMSFQHKEWEIIHRGFGKTIVLDALKPGCAYTFRICMTNKEGQCSPWSEPTTQLTEDEPLSGFDIHRAIRMYDKEELTNLLRRENAPVNSPNKIGNTPLMDAVLKEKEDFVEMLLLHGADIDSRNPAGKTSLMLACYVGNALIAEILRQYGANLQAKDNLGCNALHAAADGGHPSTTLWCLQAGLDCDQPDHHKGWTPLLRAAAMNGNSEVANVLLKAGANINYRDQDGKTALMIATCAGYQSFAHELVRRGADLTIRSNFGSSAYDMALHLGKQHLIPILSVEVGIPP